MDVQKKRETGDDRERAFVSIYNDLYPAAYHFAKSFVGAEDAADITANVFINLWRTEKDFNDLISVKAYVLISIRNASLNYLQSKKYQAQHTKEIEYKINNENPNWLEEEDLREIRKIYLQLIFTAAEELPQIRRQVLQLAFDEGLKNRDIASRLNLSETQVIDLKRRALKSLKLIMKKKGLIMLLWILNSS